jgi:predicted nucleic acid-binding protein
LSAIALDTNVYSGFMRGEPAAVQALQAAREIQLPLIVLAELLAGFALGSRVRKNREELARFMTSPRVALLNPNERTARHYADIYAALRAAGRPIPTNDLWIAALVRQHRLALVTFDAHFSAVPGLTVIHPQAQAEH